MAISNFLWNEFATRMPRIKSNISSPFSWQLYRLHDGVHLYFRIRGTGWFFCYIIYSSLYDCPIFWMAHFLPTSLKLYCDKRHIAPLLASAANIGGLAGHLIWGVCQDWFGRRKTNIFCSLMTFLFSLSLCFVPQYSFNGKLPEYSLFLLIRFFFGLCANGMGSYTLPVELGKSNDEFITWSKNRFSLIKETMDGRPLHGNGLGFGYLLAPCFSLSFPQLARCNAYASCSTFSLLALSLAFARITKMAATKK